MISIIVGLAAAAAALQTPPALAAASVSSPPPTVQASANLPDNELPASALADERGGANISAGAAVTVQDLQAIDSGNSVTAGGSISSGAISISGASLQGFNGVGNFVFNTGHNDAIQGNVTVNVVMAP
jgi:hypothetical protein